MRRSTRRLDPSGSTHACTTQWCTACSTSSLWTGPWTFCCPRPAGPGPGGPRGPGRTSRRCPSRRRSAPPRARRAPSRGSSGASWARARASRGARAPRHRAQTRPRRTSAGTWPRRRTSGTRPRRTRSPPCARATCPWCPPPSPCRSRARAARATRRAARAMARGARVMARTARARSEGPRRARQGIPGPSSHPQRARWAPLLPCLRGLELGCTARRQQPQSRCAGTLS
mmetsp:Transcript_3225/g.10682  ORF Transcript_3225/g.10682 Transcript_3225/m.10682 type:complete len:229 (+) Transcript_3225:2018-2704(+)